MNPLDIYKLTFYFSLIAILLWLVVFIAGKALTIYIIRKAVRKGNYALADNILYEGYRIGLLTHKERFALKSELGIRTSYDNDKVTIKKHVQDLYNFFTGGK
jgi:hypothetical protein